MKEQELERKPEITDAVRQFAELPRDKQEVALILAHGIAIGESIASIAKAMPGQAAPTG